MFLQNNCYKMPSLPPCYGEKVLYIILTLGWKENNS